MGYIYDLLAFSVSTDRFSPSFHHMVQ